MERFTISPETRRMLTDFYRVTGIPVGMYLPDGTLIDSYPGGVEDFSDLTFCEKSKLCSGKWSAECMRSDKEARDMTNVSGASYVYECAKGFFEAVVPIRSGEDMVLYLMIGQVRPPQKNDGDGRALFCRYGCEMREDFDETAAEQSFERMRQMDRETFEAHVRMLELCAQKIGADEFVRRSQRSVPLAVMQYVGVNLYHDITVGSAAESLNYSVSYLSHTFAREMGTSFTRYVNARRISEAKRLLRLTDMNVEKIATLLQYSSVTYFVRQFKRETGMTCTEYRALRGTGEKAAAAKRDRS